MREPALAHFRCNGLRAAIGVRAPDYAQVAAFRARARRDRERIERMMAHMTMLIQADSALTHAPPGAIPDHFDRDKALL